MIAYFVAAILTLTLLGAFDASASTIFLAVVLFLILLIVWRSAVRRSRKLEEELDVLSSELAVARQAILQTVEQLQSEITELRASDLRNDFRMKPSPAASAAPPSTPQDAEATAAPASDFGEPQIAGKSAGGDALLLDTPPPPPPSFGQTPSLSSGVFAALRSLLNFEEMLGSNWFAKLGAGILVLGIAFFLAWQLRQVGPLGKVTVGWLSGALMLGAGIYAERKEHYRILARAGVGAGWAMCFFTAYAMNHVAAAHVIDSQLADLALMFLVAAGMVLHTLRYRSQVVTGLAFLCAFLSIASNRGDVTSLLAAVVLAVGVVWIALRMEWFELEICAIAATFLNHFLWLRPIIAPMGKNHHPFPEFFPSAAILAAYWAVFRFSYLSRRGGERERISTLAALLNTGLLLAVLKYQSVNPKMAFWGLLVLGSVELSLGQLSRARTRSTPHRVLTAVGACLLVAAIPFHFGPTDVYAHEYTALVWLAEAETFFLVGVFTREMIFRRVGLAAFVALFVQLIGVETASIYGRRMDGADFKGEFFPALICVMSALVLYWNVHGAPRRWAEQFTHIIEQLAARDLSFAAASVAMASAWMAFPASGTAVAWMALGCALTYLAQRFDFAPMRVQSIALAVFVFFRVLAVNLQDATLYHFAGHSWSARLLTTAATVALCYLAAYFYRHTETSWLRWLEPGFSWVASTMLTLLVWYEFKSASVALGWAAFSLVILEVGLWRRSLHLRLQAYLAGICVFLRLLFVNLNAAGTIPGVRGNPRLITIVPLALFFFYAYRQLDQRGTLLDEVERKFRAAQIFAWFGTTTLVLLLRFEVALDWIATAWAFLVVALAALAAKSGKRIFLHQALLLSLGVLTRGVFHNLYERSYFTSPPLAYLPGLSMNTLCVVSTAGFLFAALFFAFQLRQEPEESGGRLVHAARVVGAHPEQMLFFVPLALVTAYLAVEMSSGRLTVAWSLEAVVVFLFALWVRERSYRLSGVGLLLLCVGKIMAFDIRHLGLRDKSITFMVLGALLVGVSILYTRNREKVRQFL